MTDQNNFVHELQQGEQISALVPDYAQLYASLYAAVAEARAYIEGGLVGKASDSLDRAYLIARAQELPHFCLNGDGSQEFHQ